jgi:hypothetical protein
VTRPVSRYRAISGRVGVGTLSRKTGNSSHVRPSLCLTEDEEPIQEHALESSMSRLDDGKLSYIIDGWLIKAAELTKKSVRQGKARWPDQTRHTDVKSCREMR